VSVFLIINFQLIDFHKTWLNIMPLESTVIIMCCLPNVEAFKLLRYTDTKTTQVWDHKILIQLTQCY